MERLTADANYLLHELYSHYLSRVKNGEPKSEAKMFGSVIQTQELINNSMTTFDIDQAMRELNRNGYLYNDYGDDAITFCYLEDKAIIDCELETSDMVSSAINRSTSIVESIATVFSALKKP